MFRTILLELFLPFRPKRQQTFDELRFPHRSYVRVKQNGGLFVREKQARQLSSCLSKPLTAQRCSHRLTEPSKLNEKTQMVCCRLMRGSNQGFFLWGVKWHDVITQASQAHVTGVLYKGFTIRKVMGGGFKRCKIFFLYM